MATMVFDASAVEVRLGDADGSLIEEFGSANINALHVLEFDADSGQLLHFRVSTEGELKVGGNAVFDKGQVIDITFESGVYVVATDPIFDTDPAGLNGGVVVASTNIDAYSEGDVLNLSDVIDVFVDPGDGPVTPDNIDEFIKINTGGQVFVDPDGLDNGPDFTSVSECFIPHGLNVGDIVTVIIDTAGTSADVVVETFGL